MDTGIMRTGSRRKKEDTISVVMLGPSLHTQGGISSVLNRYRDWFMTENTMKVHFIATYDGTSRVLDILYFAGSVFRVIGWCLVGPNPVFHIHTASKGSWLRKSMLAAIISLFRKPFILHMHGGGFDRFMTSGGPRRTARIVKCLRKAEKVIALSDHWRLFYANWVEPEKLTVLFNPAPVGEQISFSAVQAGAPVRFLYMGKISEGKGTFDLLRAASGLDPGTFFIDIYGNGDLDGIRRCADQNGIASSVAIHGWVPFHLTPALYEQSDVLVLPSYAEGLPMTILEAMGQGRPVIATRVGGIPDVVEDGSTGFLMDAGDIAGLTILMSRFVLEPDLSRRMGVKALAQAGDRFDMRRIGLRLVNLYSEVSRKEYPRVQADFTG